MINGTNTLNLLISPKSHKQYGYNYSCKGS